MDQTDQTLSTPLSARERRAAGALAAIFASRMLGLFMILPVFALYARDLDGATPLMIGLAIGAYGLTQALLQIPLGLLSDRIGRKPVIFAGLVLFALGSLIAALADSIGWVILGRVIQGSGAIAAAIIALTADLTREETRTKGMAIIGISVALAFAAALVIGPPLARWLGLSGIFWLTALLAIGAMLILHYWVPNPERSGVHRESQPALDQVRGVLADATLRRLDAAIFLLHLSMVSLFVVLPLSVVDAGLDAHQHWMLYLPAVLLAIPAMVPFIILAERRGRARAVILGSVGALGLAMLGLALFTHALWVIGVLMLVVFTVFNLLEAVLPALVSKRARPGAKGTAMGVFSSAQFVGAFMGGMLGGWAHGTFGAEAVYVLGVLVALLWLVLMASMTMPENLVRHVLTLGAAALSGDALEPKLLAVHGVREVVVAPDEGVAYLKIEPGKTDWNALRALAATT